MLSKGGTFALCDIVSDDISYEKTGSILYLDVSSTIRLLRQSGFKNIRYIDWSDRVFPMSWESHDVVFKSLITEFKRKRLTNEQVLEELEARVKDIHFLGLSVEKPSFFLKNLVLAMMNNQEFELDRKNLGYGMFLASK